MKIVINVDEETGEYIQGIQEFDCCDSLVNEMFYAIHNGQVLPKGCGDLVDKNELIDKLWWVSDCPRVKLNEQALEIWETIEKAPTVIEADKGE